MRIMKGGKGTMPSSRLKKMKIDSLTGLSATVALRSKGYYACFTRSAI